MKLISNGRQRHLLIAMMALSSVAMFTMFPYLALYLKTQFGLSDGNAGLAVGSIALISSCGGWLGGSIVDRVGWVAMLRFACLLYVAAFGGLALTTSLPFVSLLIALVGVGRLLLEPALKTGLALQDDDSGRMFRIRYVTLAGGAIVGPLLSVALEPFGPRTGFAFAGGIFVLYFIATLLLRPEPARPVAKDGPAASIDRTVVTFLVVLGILFFIIFSQFETTLSLHLLARFDTDGLPIYRRALVINAAMSIPMMALADRISSRLPLKAQVGIGSICMATATMALFAGREPAVVYLGAALFTVGDVVLFPLPDVVAARLSSGRNHGRLSGLVDLRYLGYFIGPALGGALLDYSPTALISVLCACAFGIHLVFHLGESLGRRASAPV